MNMNKFYVRKSKAFTLIELLVVIAIIALLLSIIVPSLKLAKETAKRSVCASNLASLGKAIFLYAEDNSDLLPPNWYQTGDGQPHHSYGVCFIDRDPSLSPQERMTSVFGWGYLFTSDFIEQGEVFYCPNAPKRTGSSGGFEVSYNYSSYSGGPGWPWNNDPSGWNNYYVRSSYQYLPQAARTKETVTSAGGSGTFPEIATKSSRLYAGHVMACDILYSFDHLAHRRGSGKLSGGLNILRADGSANFSNNAEAFDRDLWPDGVTLGNDEYRFRKVVSLLK